MKKFLLVLFVALGLVFAGFYLYMQENFYPAILMYHSVDQNKQNTLSMSLERFSQQMEYIKKHNYKVISLAELAQDLKQGRSVRRTVVITFDDGYKDNLKAVEVLKKFNFPATIFMIVGNIGKEGFLSPQDLRYIEDKTPVDIGVHTFSHAYMPDVKAQNYSKEIVWPKKVLESILARKVLCFSYPVGGFNRKVEKAVKDAGFLCAVTTNRGYSKDVDLYALRRIKISAKDKGINLWAKLSGYYYAFKKIKPPE